MDERLGTRMMVEVAFGEISCEVEETAAESSSDQDMEDELFFELLLTSVW